MLKETPTAATELFLQSLVGLESVGWFRGFLDALNAAGTSVAQKCGGFMVQNTLGPSDQNAFGACALV